jgi:peroxiredoxin
MTSISINIAAPDFTIMDYRGESFHLKDFQGIKNVLLVFNRGFM